MTSDNLSHCRNIIAILDEVIRKRLLIDGDGAGDDRRINLLVKSFVKWCHSGSQEEGYFAVFYL